MKALGRKLRDAADMLLKMRDPGDSFELKISEPDGEFTLQRTRDEGWTHDRYVEFLRRTHSGLV